MADNFTRTLARFSAELKYGDLPSPIIHEAKRILLDTVGCGLGAMILDKGHMAVQLATRMGGRPEASILGTREKVPSAIAAFANGELMNALDWNALLPPNHVPPYVIPSALALAEATSKSGKDLITAIVLALEISGRVGTSLVGLRATPGGLPLKVWGISSNQFGATAGAGWLLGLDTDRMQHAFGLAGYYAPVPSHAKYNHTIHAGYAKYGPAGWMAQAGVTTALLAEMGAHGDTTVLEGEHGFWAMNGAPGCDWNKILDRIGEHWVFTHAAYKFWPTCGMFQSPLDVFTKIISENDLKPDELSEVIVSIEGLGALPKYVNTDPRDHVEAAASLPYCIAVAAHRIKLGPGWQAQSVMEDPAIRNFMKKVRHTSLERAEELRRQDLIVEGRPTVRHRPARVEVRSIRGVFAESVDFANWLSMDVDKCRPTDTGLAEKFEANAASVLSNDKIAAAVDAMLNIEDLPDVSTLAAMLAP